MFRRLPPQGADERGVAEIVNNIMDGKTNNTGLLTLNGGGAVTTILEDARIGIDSKIILLPASEDAQADSAPYGLFLNNTDQFAASTTATAVVEFDAEEFTNGVYLDNDTEIYVENYGIYNAQFSVQLANIANSQEYADIWFRVNGSDVPNSASRFNLMPRKDASTPSHLVGTVNTFLELFPGDYIEIAGSVSSVNVSLEHFAEDVVLPRPAIPAVIFSVQYIAPLAYSNIYATNAGAGTATINHFANYSTDKVYGYIIVG
jgi:hypothetical protein